MISGNFGQEAGDFGLGPGVVPAEFAGYDAGGGGDQGQGKFAPDRKRAAALQDVGKVAGLFVADERCGSDSSAWLRGAAVIAAMATRTACQTEICSCVPRLAH